MRPHIIQQSSWRWTVFPPGNVFLLDFHSDQSSTFISKVWYLGSIF
jgi:hypothetical protein